MKIYDFYAKKKRGEKITMVTCYDYSTSRILANTSVDCYLVGDSVAMTMHGYQDTLSATLAMMGLHTQAVRKGSPDKFIVSDLPFLSYRKSLSKNVSVAETLMQAGANAVKLECAAGNAKLIQHLTESGIPVMGHLGLTPQFIQVLGGYRVQGNNAESAKRILEDAMYLERAGCFAIVLECVPTQVAKEITAALNIPTIGIGAGSHTDGQVMVIQDLLGLNLDFKPKFVRQFLDGSTLIHQSVDAYVQAILNGEFPQHEHSY